jgi:hypothetical protein
MFVAPISADGYVPVNSFGAELIDAMEVWLTRDLAWVLDLAVAPLFEAMWDLATDHGVDGDADYLPGFGVLFNVAPQPGAPGYGAPVCPTADLGYVGQFVGVQVPAGADDATARSLVLAEAGRNRGTPAAVIAAAKRNLSGTQSVTLLERTAPDGTPHHGWFTLVVRPEEVISLSALTAAVNACKLSGLMWGVVQQDAYIWSSAIHTWAADTMTWAAASGTQPSRGRLHCQVLLRV